MKLFVAFFLLFLAGLQITFTYERWKAFKLLDSEEKTERLKYFTKLTRNIQIIALTVVAAYVIWVFTQP